jgi:hypothetical protein
MEAIIIIAWIALIIALVGAGIVAAMDAWTRIETDRDHMSREGNA